MKFPGFLLCSLLLASCGPLKHPINVYHEQDEIHIKRFSKVPLATVQHIADARGGKEDGEIWYIDRVKSDIRIRKSRGGSNPNHDIEIWYQDEQGSWMKR
ncbi:MAG TPA: hypothetical protein VM511_05965 [Luteolibacter sp.]|nr:hypothetical protein [Luteolibacter sp.]